MENIHMQNIYMKNTYIYEKIDMHIYFIYESIYLGIDIDVYVLDSRFVFPPLPIPASTLVRVQSCDMFIAEQFSLETCKTELGSWWG